MLTDGHGPPLEAANSSSICTHGTRFVEQGFGWDFVTAKVAFPLIDADFLCAYGLLADVKHCRLIDAVTFCSYDLDPAKLTIARVCKHGAPLHRLSSRQPMGFTPPYRPEAWWWAPMRRLPPTQ